MPQLRPMSTGEILDRTFSNYRRNFKLFAGIAAIPAAILLLAKLLLVLVGAANSWTPGSRMVGGAALAFTIIGSGVTLLLYLVSLAVSQGATAYAVSAVHLEKPTSIRECYGRIKGRYWRMINVIISIYLRVFGSLVLAYLFIIAMIFVPMSLGIRGEVSSIVLVIVGFVGLIAGVYLSIRLFARYSLAVPAAVVEDIKTRPAIKRSIFLSRGSIGKILAIYVLVLVINMAAAFAIAIPVQMMLVFSKAALWTTLLTIFQEIGSFVVSSVVGPLATIALSLVYFDERVRKEAFDIQFMMESLPPVASQEPQAPAPDSPAETGEPSSISDPLPPSAAPAESDFTQPSERDTKAEGAGSINS